MYKRRVLVADMKNKACLTNKFRIWAAYYIFWADKGRVLAARKK